MPPFRRTSVELLVPLQVPVTNGLSVRLQHPQVSHAIDAGFGPRHRTAAHPCRIDVTHMAFRTAAYQRLYFDQASIPSHCRMKYVSVSSIARRRLSLSARLAASVSSLRTVRRSPRSRASHTEVYRSSQPPTAARSFFAA